MLWRRFTTFSVVQQAIVEQSLIGYLYFLLCAGLVVLFIFAYYTVMQQPETRVSGYLEGRTYSVVGDDTRIWEIADASISGYPEEQVFVPTIIRITENQRQGRCLSPTIPCEDDTD